MSNTCIWLREKWKIALAAILGLLGVLSVYLKVRSQKRVLQKANESHEKDNKLNSAAIKELTDGLEDISKSTSRQIEESRSRHEKKEEEVKSSKEALAEEMTHDESLGKKLAEELGAKYVEKD